MRSDIEQQLSLIALGKAGHTEVLQYFLDMFERKFGYFVKRVSAVASIRRHEFPIDLPLLVK